MKTFTKMAAQGDFLIIRIGELPAELERIQAVDGKITIAHSETGHDHVMVADSVTAYKAAGTKDVDLYELFLLVDAPTKIDHLRSFDTHEALLVPPGSYQVRRQREYVAEGFRKAQD